MEAPEINLLTLNCWGLLYLSSLRVPRLTQIGHAIAATSPAPSIVCLQECWTQEDYLAIRRLTAHILPHGKFFHSGVFGAGLAVLSRWPIEETSMLRYPLNGRPTAFFRGDWFVGKGVAAARIRFGPRRGDVVEVFNTHTHAPYEKEGPRDSYVCHRTAQAWEVAKLVRAARERGHLVVAMGDFNMVPSSLAHRIVTVAGGVRDVWRVVHPDSALGPAGDAEERKRGRPVPTAEENVRVNGVTSNSVYNTWRWTKRERKMLGEGKEGRVVSPAEPDPRGQRLDYIFVGDGEREGGTWVVKDVRVGMVERHPVLGCSLSDHFSVEATLAFRTDKPPGDVVAKRVAATVSTASDDHYRREVRPEKSELTIRDENDDEALQNGVYLRSPTGSEYNVAHGSEVLDNVVGGIAKQDTALPVAAYDEILAMIHKYVAREKRQRRWRGLHFFAWIGIWIACLVGVWFVPHNYVAFILMVLSNLGLVTGTVDGLIALLFVNTELRALKEFEWEILNAKAAAGGGLMADDLDKPRRDL
ncbi:DNase I-like protein [Coniochaeta hoffmannii]|uniref:DNase I-like protein n=1 Tax=Coniochaeta hoffmannii TaxID=91930 RepID=A0AA38RRC7_9PEZI|nr:DNase I-like protein [Coniochaeta hoffmannii]